MVAALLITLREGMEAALIVGIVLSVLQRLGMASRQREVWWGVVVAVGVSLVAGFGLQFLGLAFEGRGEEIFEGIAMLLAAGILTWMIFWMQGKGKSVQQEIEAGVRIAVSTESRGALFGLAFLAVVREGVETVLFLTAAAFSASPVETVLGGSAGLVLAVVLGWALYAIGKRLSLRPFFKITGFLLLLFAAGLLAHGVHELQEAGVIPVILEHVYDINLFIDENSGLGVFLKTLFGYNGNPSLLESLGYVFYLVVLVLLNKFEGKKQIAITS